MTRVLIAALLIVVLTGCGFHLRGAQPLPFESLYVGAPASSQLGAALRRSIRAGSGTRIVDVPQDAQAVLAVVGENREKVILSLDTAGRVREFQLRYRFVFRVHDQKGRDLVPQTEILLTRDFTFNDSVLLAKEQEEALLYADMQNDLVQQIVRRLAGAKPTEG
jgi:LPS-assembly lipoprotein